jgi:hypothetical protein
MDYSTSEIDGVWNDAMKCYVCHIKVDLRANEVVFLLAKRNVADMTGAIETAKAHLPTTRTVRLIAPKKATYEWRLKAEKWVKYGCP